MNVRASYALLFLLCTAPFVSRAQIDSARIRVVVDGYTLRVSVDDEGDRINGEALLRLRALKDSVAQLQFVFASSASLVGARDSLGKSLRTAEAADAPENGPHEFTVTLRDSLRRGDTTVVRLQYKQKFDTLSTLPSFINGRDLALLPQADERWWPVLSSAECPLPLQSSPTVLWLTLPGQYVPVTGSAPDTEFSAEGNTTREYIEGKRIPLSSAFSVCASRTFLQSVAAQDSSFRISIYYDPARLPASLADAVGRQLRNAYTFFSSVTHKERRPGINIAFVGSDDGRALWFGQRAMMVGKNSFAYSADDTALLLSSRMSPWVYALAGEFGLESADSSSWISKGWRRYLATRFFIHGVTGNQDSLRQIRLELLSRTLGFYPSRPLGQSLAVGTKEETETVNESAYLFLMLEYIMGEEAFAGVVRSLGEVAAPVTVPMLQHLCEEAYGSPLGWFFSEWTTRTGFPELILTTDISQTNRGSYSVKATVGERGDFFATPVDIVFSNDVRSITKRVVVTRPDQTFEFILPFLPLRGELDPNYFLLRWVPRLRLLAHATTSVTYRVLDHDLASSEREASLLLQLDPNNLTGWNNLAMYSLGKISVLKGDLAKAEDYFRRASSLEASAPTELYSVLSLVRLGNVLEMEGKRQEAIEIYRLSITLGERRPALYGPALFEAHKYVAEKFVPADNVWYGEY